MQNSSSSLSIIFPQILVARYKALDWQTFIIKCITMANAEHAKRAKLAKLLVENARVREKFT